MGDSVAGSTNGDGAITAIGAATGAALLTSDAELLRNIGALVGADGVTIGATVLESDAVLFRNIGAFVGATGCGCMGADDVF